MMVSNNSSNNREIQQETFEKQFFHFVCRTGNIIFIYFFLVIWHFKSSQRPIVGVQAFYTRLAWKFIKKLCLTCQTNSWWKKITKNKAEIFAKNFLLRSNSFNGILLVPEIFCINGRTFDVLFDIYLTHGNEVHKFSVQQSAILIACCIWDVCPPWFLSFPQGISSCVLSLEPKWGLSPPVVFQ